MSLFDRWSRLAIVGIATTLGFANVAAAQTLTLAWDPSPDSSVVGYIVYAGTESGNYKSSFNVGGATSFVYNVVPDQKYFFAVASYAEGQVTGPLSSEVAGLVPTVPPAPTGDVTPPSITITEPSTSDRVLTTQFYVVVGGTSADDSGVASVKWKSSRGGSGVATGTDVWLAAIPVSPGRNDIVITATDPAGNSSSVTISIQRQTSS